MPRPAARKTPRSAPRPDAAKGPRKNAAPKPYHHGDLRRVLVDAAYELVAEGGVESVSVREAARRAGVSPGAPFRHFASRDALLAAVAEEAQRRFRAEIGKALEQVTSDDPLARFRALGRAYLRWALRNPAHFEVISNGKLFDHAAAPGVSADNAEIIAITESALTDANAKGLLRSHDLRVMQIAGRALVYGFARMKTDGHFPRWGVADAEIDAMADAVLDLFVAGIAKAR